MFKLRNVPFREIPLEIGRFSYYLGREFTRDQCPRTAASLAYTTMLSLVPLLTVLFVTLSAFPAFKNMGEQIEIYIFTNFVPALGETIRGHLHLFVEKASGLRLVSFIFVVAIALLMMSTIESAFNSIWRVNIKRPRLGRFLVYWAVITLGPILIGVGLATTSYLVSLPLITEAEATLVIKGKLLTTMPYLTTLSAFVLLYKVLPNRDVPFHHAVIGGLSATLLFEAAKRGFAYYITNFPTHEAIYGALATIPIFLIWIYLSWVIVLLGAEMTRCLLTYRADRLVNKREGYGGPFFDAYRLIGRLYDAQRSGGTLTELQLMRLEPQLNYQRLDHILERLLAQRWIARTENQRWVLSRDLATLKLAELYKAIPGPLPVFSQIPNASDPRDLAFLNHLCDHERTTYASMQTLVEPLYSIPTEPVQVAEVKAIAAASGAQNSP